MKCFLELADQIMKHVLTTALFALALAGTASAANGPVTYLGHDVGRLIQHQIRAQVSPETTGSIEVAPPSTRSIGDGQGRDLRSSTRGNAQFPERAPEAQNLGETSGGPKF